MSKYSNRLNKVKDYVFSKRAEKQALENHLSTINIQLAEKEKSLALLEKSLVALQKLTDLKKKETTEKIENIISFGLQTIFEDSSYQFKILDSIKRKQVVYDFRVYSDSFKSAEGVSILDSRGGGVISIVSFLLRLVLMCMMDKKAERFMALDEPFNALSENYHENLVSAIKSITEKLGVQLLVVSHQKSLDAFGDVVYELKQVNGVTSAHLVRNDNAVI